VQLLEECRPLRGVLPQADLEARASDHLLAREAEEGQEGVVGLLDDRSVEVADQDRQGVVANRRREELQLAEQPAELLARIRELLPQQGLALGGGGVIGGLLQGGLLRDAPGVFRVPRPPSTARPRSARGTAR
jgi:hypothetical protein